MNADLEGLKRHMDCHKNSDGFLVHKGKNITRGQAYNIICFCLENGRKTTDDITDEEVDLILNR